jgi:hypothetical protein
MRRFILHLVASQHAVHHGKREVLTLTLLPRQKP